MEMSNEQIALIKKQNPTASNDEIDLFIHQVKRTNLDPLNRQIYLLNVGYGKHQAVTSVDGFRLIAQRSNQYGGQDGPYWCGDDGVWRDVWLDKAPPRACKVGVMRSGFKDYLYAIANWDAYSRNTSVWKKMSALMLAKVAECLAIRRAFPQELSGLYAVEEMDQTQDDKTTNKQPTNNQQKGAVYGDNKTRIELVDAALKLMTNLTKNLPTHEKIEFMRKHVGVNSWKTFTQKPIKDLRDVKNNLEKLNKVKDMTNPIITVDDIPFDDEPKKTGQKSVSDVRFTI